MGKLERDARPWSKLLPAYASLPETLELPQQLLKYKPASRSHPAKILCCSFFTSLPDDDESTGRLPEGIFNFAENELYPLPDSSRDSLLQFSTRYQTTSRYHSSSCARRFGRCRAGTRDCRLGAARFE